MLWRVKNDVSWRHDGVTNPPFWIWGRHIESQTSSHTVDNDDIEKLYEFVLGNILNQNEHKSKGLSLSYKLRGKNWQNDWKTTANSKIHSWEDGCYGNVNLHRYVIDKGKYSLINFRKSHEIWWLFGQPFKSYSSLKSARAQCPPPPG